MNKLIIAGIGAGATVIGYTIGSIFGNKVNGKVKNVFKKKEKGDAPCQTQGEPQAA
jgi:hypothetical protein